jgi:rubrerythrin
MAKTAREEGFAEIAEWFETLPKAERIHASRFSRGASPSDKADMTLFFGLVS